MDAQILQDSAQAFGVMIVADNTDGVNISAERRNVGNDIRRAARHDFFARLFKNQNGSLAGNAGNAPVDVDISHRVADNQNFFALHVVRYAD